MKCPRCKTEMKIETRREHAERTDEPVQLCDDDANDTRDVCPSCGTVGVWTPAPERVQVEEEQRLINAAAEKQRKRDAAQIRERELARAKTLMAEED